MDRQKVIDRVRKLLAFRDSNATENEVAVACSVAERLIEEYHLETAELQEDDFVFRTATNNDTTPWRVHLACVLAEHHRCRCLRHTTIDGAKGITVIGSRLNCEATICMFDSITEVLVREAHQHRDEPSDWRPLWANSFPTAHVSFALYRSNWDESFYAGATQRIAERLHEARAEVQRVVPATTKTLERLDTEAKRVEEFIKSAIKVQGNVAVGITADNTEGVRAGRALADELVLDSKPELEKK